MFPLFNVKLDVSERKKGVHETREEDGEREEGGEGWRRERFKRSKKPHKKLVFKTRGGCRPSKSPRVLSLDPKNGRLPPSRTLLLRKKKSMVSYVKSQFSLKIKSFQTHHSVHNKYSWSRGIPRTWRSSSKKTIGIQSSW